MPTFAPRRAIYVVAAIMMLVAALVAVLVVLPEPEYQGKTVREWVWDYALTNRQGFHYPPTAEMQHIGPRAVPLLITELQRQNSDPYTHTVTFRTWFAASDWSRQ